MKVCYSYPQINLVNGTTITFTENAASSVGGAILVRNPSVGIDIRPNSLYNHLCFIQYEVEKEDTQTLTPSEWEVRQHVQYGHF